MSRTGTVLLWGLLVLACIAACGEPVATPEPVFLKAVGSTAMEPLVADLADSYREREPLVDIEVEGLGTRFGLDAVEKGEADLALVSWLPQDLDSEWQATAIARDGLAIVVHRVNQVDGLGLLQLRDLFSGRTLEWEAIGGQRTQGLVQPVSREDGSGTRAAFETLVMEDQRVTPLAVVAPSSEAVVEYVASHPNAVGYVSMGQVTPDVKILSVEGELPSPESAGMGSYPLTRDLWLAAPEPVQTNIKEFLDFVLSPAGQQVVGRGYGRIR